MFSKNLESRGVKVHWAKDAQEFNEIVLGILKDHNVKKMVKSKSMLTEECEMNPYLEQHGIDVVETDLGERIIQLLHQKPSHIVMPAIHLKREEVGKMFEEKGIPAYSAFAIPFIENRIDKWQKKDSYETQPVKGEAFVVTDNKLTDNAQVPILLSETKEYIKDYKAY